jgi:hypothetical protein
MQRTNGIKQAMSACLDKRTLKIPQVLTINLPFHLEILFLTTLSGRINTVLVEGAGLCPLYENLYLTPANVSNSVSNFDTRESTRNFNGCQV